MLNYTYGTNGLKVDIPRIVNYIDKEIMKGDIAEAKLFNPDFIIANMHWGLEYERIPSREQRELADWLLRQGVDLVIGSHPHVVQPMELRREGGGSDRLVVYSLGNFISNYEPGTYRWGCHGESRFRSEGVAPIYYFRTIFVDLFFPL